MKFRCETTRSAPGHRRGFCQMKKHRRSSVFYLSFVCFLCARHLPALVCVGDKARREIMRRNRLRMGMRMCFSTRRTDGRWLARSLAHLSSCRRQSRFHAIKAKEGSQTTGRRHAGVKECKNKKNETKLILFGLEHGNSKRRAGS